MTTKRYDITDTAGDRWQVLPGDPAHALCDRLNKLGEEPTLPAFVIRVGRVTPEHLDEARTRLVETVRGALDTPAETLAEVGPLVDAAVREAWAGWGQLAYLRELQERA